MRCRNLFIKCHVWALNVIDIGLVGSAHPTADQGFQRSLQGVGFQLNAVIFVTALWLVGSAHPTAESVGFQAICRG